jgi:hypothetical protein
LAIESVSIFPIRPTPITTDSTDDVEELLTFSKMTLGRRRTISVTRTYSVWNSRMAPSRTFGGGIFD